MGPDGYVFTANVIEIYIYCTCIHGNWAFNNKASCDSGMIAFHSKGFVMVTDSMIAVTLDL